MTETPETYIATQGRGSLVRLIPVVGVGASGGARAPPVPRACGCPWLGRGRPEAPRHMRPSGHGGSAACTMAMGDGRTETRERVTQVSGTDARVGRR